MNKPIILFDADGVLLDFLTPALAVAEKAIYAATGAQTILTPETLNTWDIFDVIGKQYEDACYVEYEKPGFCESIRPYPEAVLGMKEMRKIADVVVVTSPIHSPTWCHERLASLREHFHIHRKDVIFTSRKELVLGRMLIDDRTANVEKWAEAHYHDQGQGVLWSQPYNADSLQDGRPSYTRYVSSWSDLLDIVTQL